VIWASWKILGTGDGGGGYRLLCIVVNPLVSLLVFPVLLSQSNNCPLCREEFPTDDKVCVPSAAAAAALLPTSLHGCSPCYSPYSSPFCSPHYSHYCPLLFNCSLESFAAPFVWPYICVPLWPLAWQPACCGCRMHAAVGIDLFCHPPHLPIPRL